MRPSGLALQQGFSLSFSFIYFLFLILPLQITAAFQFVRFNIH